MKSLVYGNGESRQVWDITKKYKGFTTWAVMQYTEMPLWIILLQ